MKYKSIILPFAKQDIEKAAIWYNSRQTGLGKRFTTEIRQKIEFLRLDPYAAIIRYDDVRTAVLNIFPFMIHYFIDEDEKAIVITSIFHTSRDTDIWNKNRED